LAKIYEFGSVDRRVGTWQWTSPQYANVIVQQPLVSGGAVSVACVQAGGAHFDEFFTPTLC